MNSGFTRPKVLAKPVANASIGRGAFQRESNDQLPARAGVIVNETASDVRVAGVGVAVASIKDLIAMKEQAGRPKDLLDVEQLRKLLLANRRDK